ncbi:hypothetical protein [Deinococcus sp. UYEF24]
MEILLFNYNYLLVFILNFTLLSICVYYSLKLFPENKIFLTLLIIANSIALLSITTINKEILGATGIILTLAYMRNKATDSGNLIKLLGTMVAILFRVSPPTLS